MLASVEVGVGIMGGRMGDGIEQLFQEAPGRLPSVATH